MEHGASDLPRLSETAGIGQLWVDDNSVEWWSEGSCFRRYNFDTPVIFSGFKRWDDLGLTLCIVLKDAVHFHYLSDNDSFVVSLPFHTSKACFFKNGLILQRVMQPDTLDYNANFENYRFICITHPMSPFGSIQFPSSASPTDLNDIELIYFPKADSFGVALFYQRTTEQLFFYSTQLLQDSSDSVTLKSPTLSLDSSNSVRKKSYGNLAPNTPGSSASLSNAIQRRKTSDIPYGFNNNNLNNNLRKRSAYNRRSTSTNWTAEDTNSEMTNTLHVSAKLAQTPNRMNSLSLSKRSMSTNVERIMEMTPTMNAPDQSISSDISKDVYLTKITAVKVPSLSSKGKVVSTKMGDKQAIGILDNVNGWGKIWIFNLNNSVMTNVRFKAFGYSPISMTKTMDIKPGIVRDVCVYNSEDLIGYFAFLQKDTLILYNPYLEITSPEFQLHVSSPDECYYISDSYMIISSSNSWEIVPSPHTYPTGNALKSIFIGIKYVLHETFHLFLAIWQAQRSELENSNTSPLHVADSDKDFIALQNTILLNLDKCNGTFAHPLYKEDPSWLAKVTMCLHLMREEFQLNIYELGIVNKLARLLTNLTSLMNWPQIWIDYYHSPDDRLHPLTVVFDQPIDEPPSIFKTLYSAKQQSHVPLTPFITLSRLINDDSCDIDDIVTPLTNKMLKLFQSLTGNTTLNLLQLLGQLNIGKTELEALPVGIYVPLKRLLLDVENEIDHVDENVDIDLIDRTDLRIIKDFISSQQQKKVPSQFKSQNISNIASSEPRSILQIYKQIAEKSLNVCSKSSKIESINYDMISTKKPIFNHKELFLDFVKTLSYSKTHSVDLPKLKLDYSNLLILKKRTATAMAYRALTSGFGYAASFLCSDPTLNQHNFVEDSLCLGFHFDVDDTIISLEKNSFPDDILSWGAFHRGVAKGLALDTDKKPLTSGWLNFNNQDVLDPEYGGFLLGLGLNHHLSVLGEWQLYNFLSPKNTYVSIGLLLGMCVSMRGSMSLKMTKVLSVHVLALLPPGSSNLNIDYKIQSTGLVGLGILYENTHNRRISELFSNELTSSININDENVPDEGYRLACGIGIGLINMGCGEKSTNPKTGGDFDDYNSHHPKGSIDPQDTNEGDCSFDFSFKSGTMDPKIIEKLVNIVVSVNDVGEDWMPVNSQLGAIIALMLVFLKTNCQTIADTISVSKPKEEVDSSIYTRPDLFIYREWCVNMIMWDKTPLDWRWILEILPRSFDPKNVTSDILPIYYRIAGRCLSVGIKGASSNSISLREGLCRILDMFLPMYQYSLEKRVDSQLLFKGITNLINCVVLAMSLIMAGSGDIEVYKRIRYLHSVSHGRNSYLYSMSRKDPSNTFEEVEEEVLNIGIAEQPKNVDYDNHYGKFMTTNMSMGFLFLGLGHYALRTANIKDLSYLIISVIPTFSAPYYLQETKYLWRLAMSERFLLVRDATTEELISDVPLLVTSKDTKNKEVLHEMKSPCLLPVIESIVKIQVRTPMYYPLMLEFGEDKLNIDKFFEKGCFIHVKKRSIEDYGKLGEKTAKNDLKAMYYKSLLTQRTANSLLGDTSEEKKSFYEEFCSKNVEDLELAHYQNPTQEFNLNLLTGLDSFDFELEIWRKRHDL
ncbi:Apc1 [Kluyveromyces lactis]|nr:Apc1 [Kluyveromyces lactis]